jgi:hypothetical protein
MRFYLFFFMVDPLFLRIMETEHDLREFMTGPGFDHIRNVADAEKAFVSVLQSGYNDVRFSAFPKGMTDYTEWGWLGMGT